MQAKELKNKKEAELQKMLADLREKSRSLRFDLAAGKVKNVREVREIKKDIAKILTILRQKEL
jgi:large subunit ribosomal protein L29